MQDSGTDVASAGRGYRLNFGRLIVLRNRLMNISRCLTAAAVACGLAVATSANAATHVEPETSFAQPAVSPDGRHIAFVADGAIWEVPARGENDRLKAAVQVLLKQIDTTK